MSANNGTPRSEVFEDLRQTRAQIKLTRAKAELALLERRQRRLTEANILWDSVSGYQDLIDRMMDADGAMLNSVSYASDRKYGANWPFWRTWNEHTLLRGAARILQTTNTCAQGCLEGLTSFVI